VCEPPRGTAAAVRVMSVSVWADGVGGPNPTIVADAWLSGGFTKVRPLERFRVAQAAIDTLENLVARTMEGPDDAAKISAARASPLSDDDRYDLLREEIALTHLRDARYGLAELKAHLALMSPMPGRIQSERRRTR